MSPSHRWQPADMQSLVHLPRPADQHFARCRPMAVAPDEPPPQPPPRTTSIRCARRPAAVSKSLVNLLPAPHCDASDRPCRRSAGPQHVHSSSSSSSSNDTFLESLRRQFSVPEFRLRSVASSHSVVSMSLSTECVTSPAARSDCSTNSSGVATCPSLSSLSGGSPDTAKGLIVRSARVEQPERQHVSSFVHFADSSTASVCTTSSSGSSVSSGTRIQCVSRAAERLSVVSSGGTSSSSGVGAGSESSGDSSGSGPARGQALDDRSESPPPPLPPKLFHSSQSSARHSDSGSENRQPAHQSRSIGSKKGCKESESRIRSRCAVPHQLSEQRVKSHSNASKNNGLSIGVSPASKNSDRKTSEKSGQRMIYYDALRRVKTSDTEIRAIQKRALMQFYFNCFKENSKNTASFSAARSASPDASSVTSPSASLSSTSAMAPNPHLCAEEPDRAPDRPPLPQSAAPFQTALPARVLVDEDEAVTDDDEESSHKREGGDLPAACATDASGEASEEMGELALALRRKQTLLQDLQRNQVLASELMSELTRNGLSPHESEKIRNHCSEIDTVTRLVLSLRCRLRSMEKGCSQIQNSLQNNRQLNSDNNKSGDAHSNSAPSSPDSSAANNEHYVLTHKRNKLLIQMEEAMSLKDMIAKRSASIRENILSKYSGEESEANDSIDYIGLMYAKSELITEISDVSERINSQREASQSVTSDLT